MPSAVCRACKGSHALLNSLSYAIADSGENMPCWATKKTTGKALLEIFDALGL
jgi:hypothetical protein